MLSLAFLATLITLGRADSPLAPRDSLRAEPVILEVVVGTTASATMHALRSGDTALLPLEQVLALVGLPAAGDTNRFESTDSLAARLSASIEVDWDELTVSINDYGRLPVTQRAIREQRRAQFERSAAAVASISDITMRKHQMLPNSVTIDYDIDLAVDKHRWEPLVRLGLGAALLGGGLDIDFARANTFMKIATAWRRSWPTYPPLRELRVGALNIANVGAGVGFALSSESSNYPTAAASILLTGHAPAGSQVEVYRDGMFIYASIIDTSTRFEIRVPGFRGPNNLKVAIFGQHGEEDIMSRYITIDETMIRRGTGTYDLSAARCTNGGCQYAAQLNMRYSPFSHATVGVDLSELRTLEKHVVDVSSVFALQLRDDLNGMVQSSSRGMHAQIQYAPDSSFELSASYRSIDAMAGLGHAGAITPRAVLSAVWRPSGLFSLTGNIDYSAATGRPRTRFRLGSFLSVGSSYIQPFVVLTPGDRSAPRRGSFGGYADAAIPFLVSGSRLRVTLGDQYSGESSLEAVFPMVGSTRIAARAAFAPGARTPRISVSLQVLNASLRYDAQASVSGPSHLTTHAMSGSVRLTAVSGGGAPVLALSSEQSRGRADIAGTVFIDDNSNGMKDDGEQGLPGVSVAIGSAFVETDAAGMYHAYDVTPFVPIGISVEPLTLPDTGARVIAVRVTPQPSELLRVDIPVSVATYQAASGGAARIDWISQHAQGGDSTPVHRNHFKSGAANTDAVANPRQATESREHEAAERGPVAFRDVEVMTRARIDER